MTDTDQKWCSRCQQWKDKSEFNKNKVRADGLQNYCKPCSHSAHSDSVAKNRDSINAKARRRRRATKIERLYGMTIEDFELLVWEQNNRCPICQSELGEHPIPFRQAESSLTAALLCETCGAGLRFFEQSTDRLFRAISFLDSFNLRETTAVKDESQEQLLA